MRNIVILFTVAFLLLSGILGRVDAQSAVTAQSFRVVNVRGGPGVQTAVIGQLRPGTVVQVIGRNNETSDWLLIEFGDMRGWVAQFVVEVTGDTTLLPIVDEPPDTTGAGTVAEFVIATPALAAPAESITASAFRRANVRSGASTQAAVIGVLERGAEVMVIGRDSEDNDWLLIQTGDLSGWVAFFLVSVNGDPNTLPIVPPQISAAEVLDDAAGTMQLIARYNVNLRAAPSLTATIIATVPFNTVLTATGRSRGNAWVRVIYDDVEGWLLKGLVRESNNGNINMLPVVE